MKTSSASGWTIDAVPVLADNYVWVLSNATEAVVVDPDRPAASERHGHHALAEAWDQLQARRDQLRMAQAIVKAVANHDRPEVVAEVSAGLPAPMRGVAMESIPADEQLAKRGW